MSARVSLLVVAVLVVIWGSTWAAISVGLQGIPPFTGIALRFAIASAVLAVGGRLAGVRFGREPRERWLWLMNGVLSFVISYGVIYSGEQWVPSGLAAILFATFPLWVALLARFVLPGESMGLAGWLGTVAGFVGVAVIFSEDLAKLGGPGVSRGAAIILVSPIVCAVANVVIKRYGAGVHPLSLTTPPMAFCAAVAAVAAWIFERERAVVFDATSVAALLYLAVFGSAVTFGLYYWLLAHHRATRVSLIAYGTPIVAVLIGQLWLDEPITARVLAGAALVIGGVALATARPAAPANPILRDERR